MNMTRQLILSIKQFIYLVSCHVYCLLSTALLNLKVFRSLRDFTIDFSIRQMNLSWGGWGVSYLYPLFVVVVQASVKV